MARHGSHRTRWPLWTAVLLSGIGIYVAGYLVTKRFTGGSLACTRWAQCDVVNNSVYSQILGIPVSVVGLAGYVLLLGVALVGLWADEGTRRRMLLLGFLLSLGGVGFSLYLTYLEVYVIEALCAWCLASAVIITLLALVFACGVWRPAHRGA